MNRSLLAYLVIGMFAVTAPLAAHGNGFFASKQAGKDGHRQHHKNSRAGKGQQSQQQVHGFKNAMEAWNILANPMGINGNISVKDLARNKSLVTITGQKSNVEITFPGQPKRAQRSTNERLELIRKDLKTVYAITYIQQSSEADALNVWDRLQKRFETLGAKGYTVEAMVVEAPAPKSDQTYGMYDRETWSRLSRNGHTFEIGERVILNGEDVILVQVMSLAVLPKDNICPECNATGFMRGLVVSAAGNGEGHEPSSDGENALVATIR